MWDQFLRLLGHWKLLTGRKILFAPHILGRREKILFLLLAVVVLVSGSLLAGRLFLLLTKPIPRVSSSYAEGILHQPRTINPLIALSDADRDISRLVFSGLLSYSGAGAVEPDLALRYEVSADAKIYTVALRQDARWHDDEPVTADDVLFTVAAIQNPQYKSPLRVNWQGVEAEKIDQHTVRFSLRSSYAPFIENLTVGILPKHLWGNIAPSQMILHELNIKPVGSGPYAFDDFGKENDGKILWYRLARNPRYYREGPFLKTVTFYFFENEEDMASAWQKRIIEGYGPVPETRREEILRRRESRLLSLPMPRIFGIFFNKQKNPILADAAVRRAIAYAVDRDAVAAKTFSGGASPMDAALPSGYGIPEKDDPPAFDPKKAAEILDKAGWKDDDGDGTREKILKKKGKSETAVLRFTLTTSDWPDLLAAAEAIRGTLRNAGIDVTIEKKPFTELESAVIRPRNFELLLFGQVYGYEVDPFPFWHSSQIKDPGLNITSYSQKTVDRLLEEARRTTDSAARAEKLSAFEDVVGKDIPAVFLYSQRYLYLLPADMQGVGLSRIVLPADRFNSIHGWYRKTWRVFK
jgi:peptide/nickel transport system substrate-binding protein